MATQLYIQLEGEYIHGRTHGSISIPYRATEEEISEEEKRKKGDGGHSSRDNRSNHWKDQNIGRSGSGSQKRGILLRWIMTQVMKQYHQDIWDRLYKSPTNSRKSSRCWVHRKGPSSSSAMLGAIEMNHHRIEWLATEDWVIPSIPAHESWHRNPLWALIPAI